MADIRSSYVSSMKCRSNICTFSLRRDSAHATLRACGSSFRINHALNTGRRYRNFNGNIFPQADKHVDAIIIIGRTIAIFRIHVRQRACETIGNPHITIKKTWSSPCMRHLMERRQKWSSPPDIAKNCQDISTFTILPHPSGRHPWGLDRLPGLETEMTRTKPIQIPGLVDEDH